MRATAKRRPTEHAGQRVPFHKWTHDVFTEAAFLAVLVLSSLFRFLGLNILSVVLFVIDAIWIVASVFSWLLSKTRLADSYRRWALMPNFEDPWSYEVYYPTFCGLATLGASFTKFRFTDATNRLVDILNADDTLPNTMNDQTVCLGCSHVNDDWIEYQILTRDASHIDEVDTYLQENKERIGRELGYATNARYKRGDSRWSYLTLR